MSVRVGAATSPRSLKWLWARWTFAHFLPALVATPTPYGLAEANWSRELIGVVTVGLVTVTLAAAQALAIRRAVPAAKRWMAATFGGLLLAFLVSVPVLAVLDSASVLPEAVAVPMAHGLGGAALGAVQWTVLRYHAPAAGRWIVVSAIASAGLTVLWLPFFDVWYIPGHVRGLFPGATELTTALRVSMVYGLATGWALQRIVRSRVAG